MRLSDVCANQFLFLVTFRRQVRNGVHPELKYVKSKLLELFAEQERIVRDDGRLHRLYEKIKYILYVLADEILLVSNWEHADLWQHEHLLEWQHFKTNEAGEEFYRRLESEGERDDELAEVYYLALCLGFQGKYGDEPGRIQDLKWRLYRMLPNRFGEDDARLTPQAYAVAEGERDPLKPMANLGRIAIACIVLLVGIWIAHGAVEDQVVDEIQRLNLSMKADAAPAPDEYEAFLAEPEPTPEPNAGSGLDLDRLKKTADDARAAGKPDEPMDEADEPTE